MMKLAVLAQRKAAERKRQAVDEDADGLVDTDEDIAAAKAPSQQRKRLKIAKTTASQPHFAAVADRACGTGMDTGMDTGPHGGGLPTACTGGSFLITTAV